ncbi:MAG: class I SAM-dependent methyltransferase [Eubacteriales bacterium]|nr:class I SAM-dependent methyltransferase [Eubacteriales bacterium]
MSKQNIYDNEVFFEDYERIRSDKINFNDLIETPILHSMLPKLQGKKVLDIGCGMGHHAKQYSDMGAESVLGIDISEKMLNYAKEHNSAHNVAYVQMPLEELSALQKKFDLVTSSLVFDYVENLDVLFKDVYNLLNEDSEFVFSMSHPMATAYDGTYPRYTRSASGKRLYANINNYFVEGVRKVPWVVKDYELYHRTVSSIINSIIQAGFEIASCKESQLPDEIRNRYPDTFGGTIHRPDFIFFRCRK